jgi:hypothetical protein
MILISIGWLEVDATAALTLSWLTWEKVLVVLWIIMHFWGLNTWSVGLGVRLVGCGCRWLVVSGSFCLTCIGCWRYIPATRETV